MDIFVRFSLPAFLSECPDDAVLFVLHNATHEMYRRLAERGVDTDGMSGNRAVELFEGSMLARNPEERVQ